MSALIEINKISKVYNPGENAVYALKDINLTIEKGEFIAIVGSSGSGKSTLMNILGCLDIPSSGTYSLEGSDVSSFSDDELSVIRNKKIGFIFQGFNLVQSLNAIENVELPLAYRGIKHSQRRELALQALQRVCLEDRAFHLPSQLSGGQQQRVAIARAIAARPPIILADEPTGNLDIKSGNDVMEILFDLNNEGKTIILITHD
ncbi:MAG: ABC transporter ATP-binding protein, partial [Oscillospiraceae bacterium]